MDNEQGVAIQDPQPEAKHYNTTVEAIQFFTGMVAEEINKFIDCDADYEANELQLIDGYGNVKVVNDRDFILKNREGECVVIREKEFKMFYTAQDYVAPPMSTLTDEQEDSLEAADDLLVEKINSLNEEVKYACDADVIANEPKIFKLWKVIFKLREQYMPEFYPPTLDTDYDEDDGSQTATTI